VSTRTREPAARARSPRPPVDPRVRERWIAARRAEGRRRLRWVVAVLGLAALVAVAWGVSVSPLLDVDHVVVVGTHHATAAEIESAAGIHRGDALAWIDTGRAVDGVDALPYVRSARIERRWPDAVRIAVVERVAVAWVEGGGRRAVVDGSGRVLELVTDPPAGLPRLASTTAVPPVGGWIRGVAAARVAAGLGALAGGAQSITSTAAGVNLQLVNGPELRLGDPDRVAVKVRAATAVLGAMQGQVVHYVDVSVPTNPVAG
jgi:cell division protein FtsQ